jgi:4-phosphopantoate--beta-alanine ligase
LNINLPESHPRYHSLLFREKIIQGQETKVVAPAGLIAHGRGEAFDYLIGEETLPFADKALQAGVLALLNADRGVISVNGNVAALIPGILVQLAEITGTHLEINLFYRTPGREEAIAEVLKAHGAKTILGIGEDADASIPELQSDRRRVSSRGILKADVVFVPLEDGDRTEALVNMGKSVITVDLNPLSRTAQKSQITIVDNIVRCGQHMLDYALVARELSQQERQDLLDAYDNRAIISASLKHISNRIKEMAGES